MSRSGMVERIDSLSFPRSRGDEPQAAEGDDLTLGFSPLTRG